MAAEDLLAGGVSRPARLRARTSPATREIPDHPLVQQTLHDCLHEAMDIDGLDALLQRDRVRRGEGARARPAAALAARAGDPRRAALRLPRRRAAGGAPHAGRGIAPLARSAERGGVSAGSTRRPSRSVREEAWPCVRDCRRVARCADAAGRSSMRRPGVGRLAKPGSSHCAGSDARHSVQTAQGSFWVAAEQLPMLRRAYPQATISAVEVPAEYAQRALGRGHGCANWCAVVCRPWVRSPPTSWRDTVAGRTAASTRAAAARKRRLRAARPVHAGMPPTLEWCERRLLARIHRYTISTLRAEIEPVERADFMRFLLDWQGVTREPQVRRAREPRRDRRAARRLSKLPAVAWEAECCPRAWTTTTPPGSTACASSGRALWARLRSASARDGGPVRATPIALLRRADTAALWQRLSPPQRGDARQLSSAAQAMAGVSAPHGASFFDELLAGTRPAAVAGRGQRWANWWPRASSTPTASAGCAHCWCRSNANASSPRVAGAGTHGLDDAGRWSLLRPGLQPPQLPAAGPEQLEADRAGCCCAATAWCSAGC